MPKGTGAQDGICSLPGAVPRPSPPRPGDEGESADALQAAMGSKGERLPEATPAQPSCQGCGLGPHPPRLLRRAACQAICSSASSSKSAVRFAMARAQEGHPETILIAVGFGLELFRQGDSSPQGNILPERR